MDRMELLAKLGDAANSEFGATLKGSSKYGPTGDAIECAIALAEKHGYKSLGKLVNSDRELAEKIVTTN